MPRNDRITGHKWKYCERCGEEWPKTELVRETGEGHPNGGYWVCPKCVDEPGFVLHTRSGNEEGE